MQQGADGGPRVPLELLKYRVDVGIGREGGLSASVTADPLREQLRMAALLISFRGRPQPARPISRHWSEYRKVIVAPTRGQV